MKTLRVLALFVLLLAGLVTLLAAGNAGAADHLDAPLVMVDGRTDINDVYAFQSPARSDMTVLVMTVNPVAGVLSPTSFDNRSTYRFHIDNNGDALTDVLLELRFGPAKERSDGAQRVTLWRRTRQPDKTLARYTGWTGEDVALDDGGRLRADLFDDPFFFDLIAFRNGLAFCPTDPAPDFFAGLDVTAIVAEVPSAWLTGASSHIGVWAQTTRDEAPIDRMGRPAINTVFIPSSLKNAFNQGLPVNDQANFRSSVVATLLALGNSSATANALADVLLPDILTFDTASAAGFLNGRRLSDDVIDAELALITGGAVPGDCVDANDVLFPGVFPYLAAPHGGSLK